MQSIEIGADQEGIGGFFKLSFKGEATDNIKWDAPATGAGSVKEKLERLSTVGTVAVTRDYTRMVVPYLVVTAFKGAENLTVVANSADFANNDDDDDSPSLVQYTAAHAGLQQNDLLFVAGVHYCAQL